MYETTLTLPLDKLGHLKYGSCDYIEKFHLAVTTDMLIFRG